MNGQQYFGLSQQLNTLSILVMLTVIHAYQVTVLLGVTITIKNKLEYRVRFELTVLALCRRLHWATLPSVCKFGALDQIRTDDRSHTKGELFQLSYKGETGGRCGIRTHGTPI